MFGQKSKRAGAFGVIGGALSRLTLVQQFVVVASLILGLTMTLAGSWINQRIINGTLNTTAEAAALYMTSYLEPHVQELADGGELSPQSMAALRDVAGKQALLRHVRSIKVWRPDGVIAFSTQPDIIGSQFDTSEIELAMNGIVKGYLHELDEDENAFERSLDTPLYEIYAPLYDADTGKVIAVGEFYEDATRLEGELSQATFDNWIVVGGSTVAMLLLLFIIVNRGSRTIDQQQRELREQLERQAELHRANEDLRNRMQAAMREALRIDQLAQRRIGVELHDGPAQLLTFILLRLDEIEDMLTEAGQIDERRRLVLGELRTAAKESMSEIREIANGLFLRAPEEGAGLVETISRIVLAHERRTDMPVTFTHSGPEAEVSADVVRCVARIVQEALNNAYKHAGGRGQAVALELDPTHVVATVSDEGPGMVQDPVASASLDQRLGVAGMQYRAEAYGGKVEIHSQPRVGTQVICSIPLAV